MADENLILSKQEEEMVKRVAKIHNISIEEAAQLVVKREMERRVRLRTGKGPAKVYDLKRKK